ncbi:MAG: hypothetical protein HYV07_15040 [Deltaproteobacteria bacterium]|nr:hypothetical protein [Deltaproteobacteria bacterium]
MNTKIVGSVGQAFVNQVQSAPPAAAQQLQAEFAAFSQGLSPELRGPLKEFVKDKLQSDPSTAWMASALVQQAPAQGSSTAARQALTEIKSRNDQLHDKSVKKGISVQFSSSDGPVSLPEVMKKLEAGENLNMQVAKYEKTSGWAVAGAMLLGGSVPYLEGVALNQIEITKKVPVNSAAELVSAWQDAQLV